MFLVRKVDDHHFFDNLGSWLPVYIGLIILHTYHNFSTIVMFSNTLALEFSFRQ